MLPAWGKTDKESGEFHPLAHHSMDVAAVFARMLTPMDPDKVEGFDADVVVLATGSQPAGNGWQRGLPTVDRLPGADLPNVFPVEDVMSRAARPGHRIIVLDDTGT